MITTSFYVNDLYSTPHKPGPISKENQNLSTECSIKKSVAKKKQNPKISTFEFSQENNIESLFSGKKTAADRFIPVRASSKLHLAFSKLDEEDSESKKEKEKNPTSDKDESEDSPDRTNALLRNYLRSELLDIPLSHSRITGSFASSNMFSYNHKSGYNKRGILSSVDYPYEKYQAIENSMNIKKVRKIPKIPFKVLDAPALQDDFYLNLLDWSESNLLSVGLSSCVYLWSAANGKVFKVCDLGNDDMVTSVSWSKKGSHLAVGTNLGEVHIWDINKVKKVRSLEGHTARVGTLAWGRNCMASGSRDKSILLRDIRTPRGFFRQLNHHKQEVCGLKWSYDDQMFCSGGNDNKLLIWTPKSTEPIFKSNKHKAAVKALAWSPHQHGLLASGGGTADRCIRFWNAHQGKMVNSVDTGSQVCNLLFSKNRNELVSTHGYTQNQIHVWDYADMSKVATLTGHTFRVLYLAMSPDGKTIVTGAGDETLRFWNIDGDGKKKRGSIFSGEGGFDTKSIMIR